VYFAFQGSIGLLSFDKMTGALKVVKTVAAGGRSEYIAVSPDGRFAYVEDPVVEGPTTQAGKIHVFTLDATTGVPSRIQSVDSGGVAPYHTAVHPSGSWVFVANGVSGTLAVFPVMADGKLGTPSVTSTEGQPSHVVFDAAGRHVFVACARANAIAQYRFDPAHGTLTPNDPASVVLDIVDAGPRHLALHPTGRWAYAVTGRKGYVTQLTLDAARGTLGAPTSLPTSPTPERPHGGSHIVVHPSGVYVYLSDRVMNFVAGFRVDATSGRLTALFREDFGRTIVQPRDFDIDREGNHLIVASKHTHVTVVLRLDPATGKATPLGEPVKTCCLPQGVVIAD
jgi:6-phosphogluconolactonase